MRKFVTLILALSSLTTLFAQRLEYDKSSKWFLGANIGATWHTTDVENDTYTGWGLILGKSFNYRDGKFFSFDLRGRYLRGQWYGQDYDSTNLDVLGANYNGPLSYYKDSLGYTVNNFNADVHELGLELAIHPNRLVNRTGWDPYIFGGINAVWNRTYGDLLNQDNFLGPNGPYNYDSIGINAPALNTALDGIADTPLDGSSKDYKVEFMPSLGFGIGYQFGPRFSLGLEHKTTFTLNDYFDGWQEAPADGSRANDIYHYTSAYVRFRFRKGDRHTNAQHTNNNTSSYSNPAPCQKPVVQLVNPSRHTIETKEQYYVFKVDVKYVAGRNDITLRVNGAETTNFLYNHHTHRLETSLYLKNGTNTIQVTGRNGCGTDTETVTIVYDDCEEPNVNFRNVSKANGAQVEQAAYPVQAEVKNATSIVYKVNGVRYYNFTYDGFLDLFESNIILRKGANTIQITATNDCGTDTKTTVVTFTDCADPAVIFVAGNGAYVQEVNDTYQVQAHVHNARSRNDIRLKVNGADKNFMFNATTGLLQSNLNLRNGSNTIQVTVTNGCGTDTETITVEYTPCLPPVVQMLLPAATNSGTATGTQLIRAKLLNVSSINQVQLLVNGVAQTGGTFNAFTKTFEETVALNSGANTIQIVVNTPCGTTANTVTVNYTPCIDPDVQMIFPIQNAGLTSDANLAVQAMVFNAGAGEITTLINGTQQGGGTFQANGLYQNTVNLSAGLNTIQVIATNDCGSDVQTATITLRACTVPAISVISPSGNPFYTVNSSQQVKATITGVTNASQIQMLVNGVVDASGASLSGTTYTNNVTLIPGNNTIKIVAANNCGSVHAEVLIVREVVEIEEPVEEKITICHIPPGNTGNPQQIEIPLSAWPAHQAHGDLLGPCPEEEEEKIVICHIPPGNAGNAREIEIPLSAWPAHQAHGDLLGPCPDIEEEDEQITICMTVQGVPTTMQIMSSEWSAYEGLGATMGACPEVEEPVEEEKLMICHIPPGNSGNPQQIEIPLSAWPAHQAHGDVLGPCPEVEEPVEEEKLIICHIPPGNPDNPQQIEIPLSAWPAHQAHGDILGPCPTEEEEEEKVVICHFPPGNNGNPQQIEIALAAWPAHQAHGDLLGPCPETGEEEAVDENKTMIVCLKGKTKEILVKHWTKYQSLGATEGECPEEEEVESGIGETTGSEEQLITICFTPAGEISSQTMKIPQNEWETYRNKGASLGPCSNVEISPGGINGAGGGTSGNTEGTGNAGGGPGGGSNKGGSEGGDGTGSNMPTVPTNGSTNDQKKKEEAARRKAEEQRKAQEEAAAKKAAEAAARKKAEEAARRKAEEQRKAKEEAAAKKAAEAAARKKAEEEAKRKATEETKQKPEEESKKGTEEKKEVKGGGK